MKRCPKCDFCFASFHHVCDFDGTDLVDDPSTLPVSPGISALAATQSPYLRLIKSPVSLAVLALAGLVSSALLIGYFDAASQPNSFAESHAARDAVVSLVPSVQTPVEPQAQVGTQAPFISRAEISKPKAARDLSAARERSVTDSRSRTRLRSSPSLRNQQNEIALQGQAKDKPLQKESKEGALQPDSKKNPNRKESKLTAALKTTWNVIRKPFKF